MAEEGKTQNSSWLHNYGENMKNNDDYNYQKSSYSNSMVSNGSISNISSSDTEDDDDETSSSSNSSGGLYDFSEIMTHLPIKRGLSKFYQGKSESFTSLSRATSLEDLVKKATPYISRKKLKAPSKSCGTGLNSYKSYTHPKPIISKKSTAKGSASLSFTSKRGSCVSNNRPPMIPHPPHKNLGF